MIPMQLFACLWAWACDPDRHPWSQEHFARSGPDCVADFGGGDGSTNFWPDLHLWVPNACWHGGRWV